MNAPHFTFECQELREGEERGIEVKAKRRLVTYWIQNAVAGVRARQPEPNELMSSILEEDTIPQEDALGMMRSEVDVTFAERGRGNGVLRSRP